jgi:hypothetical protein
MDIIITIPRELIPRESISLIISLKYTFFFSGLEKTFDKRIKYRPMW